MPPHVLLSGVLSPSERQELLAFAVANQAMFKPGEVYANPGESGGRLDPDRRKVLKLREFGPLKPMLEQRLFDLLPQIMAGTGYRGSPPASLELELNAYGEGGHFNRHVDIPLGPDRMQHCGDKGEDRLLSAVYYFYSEPKGFTGGALRLFRFGANGGAVGPDDVVSYEPQQNSLVAFPSWAMHEVETVHCPTGRFADHRFALNCWFCAKLGS